nr:hypothetical protein B14D6.560 [imported] - Neurospora crassa [Neurospora crassa]
MTNPLASTQQSFVRKESKVRHRLPRCRQDVMDMSWTNMFRQLQRNSGGALRPLWKVRTYPVCHPVPISHHVVLSLTRRAIVKFARALRATQRALPSLSMRT